MTAASVKIVPRDGEFANTEGIEEFEKAFAHVQGAVRATRTLIRNSGNCARRAVTNHNLLKALGSRRAVAILGGVQSDNKVAGSVGESTGAKTVQKVCGVATETLLEVASDLVMVALGGDKGGTNDGKNEGS